MRKTKKKTTKKFSKLVVRKGSLTEDRYLTRGCVWTRVWRVAAKFASQRTAIAAAKRCQVGNDYGLFPTGPYPMRP